MILERNENAAKILTKERATRIQKEASQTLECLGVLESMSEKGHTLVAHLEQISHGLEEEAHRLNGLTIAVSELGSINAKATEFCELSAKELMKVKNNADALLTYSHRL